MQSDNWKAVCSEVSFHDRYISGGLSSFLAVYSYDAKRGGCAIQQSEHGCRVGEDLKGEDFESRAFRDAESTSQADSRM